MVILLTGSTGFIGAHLARALAAAGHTVIGMSRSVQPGERTLAADFATDTDPCIWADRLRGIDVVINAVGILRESGTQSFDALHARAPQALFQACALAGVRRVVQISALGADEGTSGYFRSKRIADDFLMTLPLEWTIVQPSLVYGSGGTSAQLFSGLASLPVIPVPGDGMQRVQPIHIDDLTAAIIACLEVTAGSRRKVSLVGPRPMTLRDMLVALRGALGLRRAAIFPVPMSLMRLAARIGEWLPRSMLDRDTLAMLQAGNVADPSATTELLRRPPRNIEDFVPRDVRAAAAYEARLQWLLPLLRLSVAAVWIWTAIVSFGLYPRQESFQLLVRTGVPSSLAPLFLYGAATLDLLFGLATLLARRRRMLWLAQIALIVLYTIIITIKLPEYWLHPYGPILKNLPMLAVLYLLYVLENPQWNTSS